MRWSGWNGQVCNKKSSSGQRSESFMFILMLNKLYSHPTLLGLINTVKIRLFQYLISKDGFFVLFPDNLSGVLTRNVGTLRQTIAKTSILMLQAVERNAPEMWQYLDDNYSDDPTNDSQCVHHRRVFVFVDNIPQSSNRQPKNPLPHTHQQHCIKRGEHPQEVVARNLSCYCVPCINGQGTCSEALGPFKPWVKHLFKFQKEVRM